MTENKILENEKLNITSRYMARWPLEHAALTDNYRLGYHKHEASSSSSSSS